MTGGVSKHHYGRVVAFIKLIFEMGIVSSFWASQEGGYPLGDIESEELENVSLFNLFLPKKASKWTTYTVSKSHQILLLCSHSVVCDSLRPPWMAACQASLSFTISQSLLKHMSIQLVMPASLLIPCHPLLLLPSSFPSIGVFF